MSLLHGEKMYEDCKDISGILPLNTVLSSMVNGGTVFCEPRQYSWRQKTLIILYSGMRGEEEEEEGSEGLGTACYLGH